MGRIVVVRHGQASIHSSDYDQLSELGVLQSQRLGALWAERSERVDAVFVGPARRHAQTEAEVAAAMVSSQRGWPMAEPLPQLDEHDAFGLVREALPLLADDPEVAAAQRELKAATDPGSRAGAFQRTFEAVMRRWISGEVAPPGIESWPDFRTRVGVAFDRLQQACAGGKVVVAFSSVGPVAAMLHASIDCTPQRAFEIGWRLRNSAISRFVSGRGLACLDIFNATPHLADPAEHTYR